jgi:hypothetical protein
MPTRIAQAFCEALQKSSDPTGHPGIATNTRLFGYSPTKENFLFCDPNILTMRETGAATAFCCAPALVAVGAQLEIKRGISISYNRELTI